MLPQVLDTAPIAPPAVETYPKGRKLSFGEIVRQAAMRNVVTLSNSLDIRVHGGPRDFRVPAAGRTVYCLSGSTLPASSPERAREILRRLAYGFNDYAAREVVARYHRDLKRAAGPKVESDDEARSTRRALAGEALKVKRVLQASPDLSVSELAQKTGLAQPNVSRAIAALKAAGAVVTTRQAKRILCRLA